MTTPTDDDREAAKKIAGLPSDPRFVDSDPVVQAFEAHRLLGQRQGIEAKGWQDIATAPRDGEPVLLYKPDERMVGPYMLAGYWGEWPGQVDTWIACNGTPMGYWSSVTESGQGYPTHWMPLPAAPEAVGQ